MAHAATAAQSRIPLDRDDPNSHDLMGSVVSRSDEAAAEGDIGVIGMELVASREDVVRGPCVQDQILPLLRCRQHLTAAREYCHPKMPLSYPSSEVECSFS